MKKILFVVPHRIDRSPSQRYRFEQYLNTLERRGFTFTVSSAINKKSDAIFYGKGSVLKKLMIALNVLFIRISNGLSARKYDLVYIHKSGFFWGSFIEKWLRKFADHIIYDFDDAIWLMDKNPNQGMFNRLKNPNKVAKIIALADQVIVGNEYLKEYALQFNPNVIVIPSTIDFEKYRTIAPRKKEGICIGWTGSFSTIKHFETVVPALEKIKAKYGMKIHFKLIGDPSYHHSGLGLQGVKWQSETEAEDLSELDVGLMPLPDNEWTRGKCAMKGLQYMALEIPTIMSPVGVNKDIIRDGENGFLASSTEEWVEKLSLLIEDAALRKKMGTAGRVTVEKDYSVEANKDKWLRVFQDT